MDIQEAITKRHSVRSYSERPIEGSVKEKLQNTIAKCNEESGLHIQLITGEPKAFSSRFYSYGKFKGVNNYILMAGPADADEDCGYYGEQIVLEAQMLGLNTCWVGLTYKKVSVAYELNPGEKVYLLIAVGYGVNQGVPHKIKSVTDVASVAPGVGEMPEWFVKGVESALLAPTAINQQKFHFTLEADGSVSATTRWGFFSRVDLGIAKLHFELASGYKFAK